MEFNLFHLVLIWVGVAVWIGFVVFFNRKVHPRALFYLFFAEFWERFSYYGMRALLILYMVKGLKYADAGAYGIYAAYGAMVYATPILGGLIADKMIGYQKAILWGGILMAFGHFAMAFEYKIVFFLALALLIMGNGFFKPNISSFIATFYEKNDIRKDSAYTIFYMGINAGAFLTPLTCGFVGQTYSWHWGFALAGIGMVLGLLVFAYGRFTGVFEDKGQPAENAIHTVRGIRSDWLVYAASIVVLPAVMLLVHHNDLLDIGLIALGVCMLGFLGWIGYSEPNREDGQRVWVVLTLLLFTTLFWTFFELAGSAITLYTERNVDLSLFGLQLKASMFQSVNPGFIILFAPAFSWMWKVLGKKNIEPSAPVKFSAGLFLLGLGFFAFTFGKGMAVSGMVPVMVLILAYLLHTLGELCLSPVGLSLVTKLSPARIVGMIMGIWFISSSLAHQFGKFISNLTAKSDTGVDTKGLPAVDTLPIYTNVFTTVGIVACCAAVLLLCLSPVIKKAMHGIR